MPTAPLSPYALQKLVAILEDRGIAAADTWDAAPVAVVSRALARRHFQDGEAIGRRMLLGDDDRTWHTVVGVVSPEMEVGNLAVIDLWIAIPFETPGPRADRDRRLDRVIARAQRVLHGIEQREDGIFYVAQPKGRCPQLTSNSRAHRLRKRCLKIPRMIFQSGSSIARRPTMR